MRPGGLSNDAPEAVGRLVVAGEDSLFGLPDDPGREISRDTVRYAGWGGRQGKRGGACVWGPEAAGEAGRGRRTCGCALRVRLPLRQRRCAVDRRPAAGALAQQQGRLVVDISLYLLSSNGVQRLLAAAHVVACCARSSYCVWLVRFPCRWRRCWLRRWSSPVQTIRCVGVFSCPPGSQRCMCRVKACIGACVHWVNHRRRGAP